MSPQFLVPETTVTEKGTGESIPLDAAAGNMMLLTLGITDIVEQEALDIAIQGSADGEQWEEKPLRAFPQKFYRGSSSILFHRGAHADVKFLRAKWEVQRWGVGSQIPMFRFYLFVEPFPES
jgi:hypothetical protein